MAANTDLLARLQEFIESEARSCSMDPGCITPEYVYRMFGSKVSLEEIEEGFTELRNRGFSECTVLQSGSTVKNADAC